MDRILLLEDGRVFTGFAFAAARTAVGEVVFNTSITGYQEIVTDPSYCGQIITLTASQIGNTGVNALDAESSRPHAAALVVRDLSPRASSWRAERDLDAYLREHGVPGLTGVDTRALTRHIRSCGAMKGVIAPAATAPAELNRLLEEAPSMQGLDLTARVTCALPHEWDKGGAERLDPSDGTDPLSPQRARVVVLDFGVKRSTLRRLVDEGCAVTVVPASTSAEEILALNPAGILLSNGPGDPAAVRDAIRTVGALLGRCPIFGICLGHQILALALGGRTFKLKFGHRGGNHPVRHPDGGPVCITAQNHGFAVDPDLPDGVRVTEINLNDGTVEAIEHPEYAAFGVQYHPEAGPGPHEASHHFRRFRAMIGHESQPGEIVTRPRTASHRMVGQASRLDEP